MASSGGIVPGGPGRSLGRVLANIGHRPCPECGRCGIPAAMWHDYTAAMAKGPQRRLAAVVSVDVAGYSRLMGRNERGTLDALKAHRMELIDDAITEHGGRIVKTTGDGMLLEFPSVVAAVDCCVAVQDGMALRNADIPSVDAIRLRIGIHLGDVIAEGDDIFGDGVNIAARLQEAAEPDGIAVSTIVHDYLDEETSHDFVDVGERELKNIRRPIRIWQRMKGQVTPRAEPLALPDKPSIAVLPFSNMSGDPEQEYFSDGMTEDIITALSRLRWLFVIARNSTFTYKGQAVDIKQVGREMGVRYVLEGSVRKAGSRVRITAQLIDADTGSHIWAERYDRELTDVFAVQDEITETVVATIEPQLYVAESERANRKAPDSLDAWDMTMRSMPHLWRMTGPDIARAQELLQAAIRRDPGYARAHGLLGFSYIWNAWMGWGEDPTRLISEAESSARRAIAHDDQDPWAHLVMGAVHGYARRHEDAVGELRKALELNPNFSLTYVWLGIVLGYAGKVDEAIEALDQAYRISPRDPFNAWLPALRSIALFTAARDAEVRDLARESIKARPEFVGAWRILTVTTAHLGELEEARRALAETKRLQPTISLAWAQKYGPWLRPQDLERYVEGFRLAGLE